MGAVANGRCLAEDAPESAGYTEYIKGGDGSHDDSLCFGEGCGADSCRDALHNMPFETCSNASDDSGASSSEVELLESPRKAYEHAIRTEVLDAAALAQQEDTMIPESMIATPARRRHGEINKARLIMADKSAMHKLKTKEQSSATQRNTKHSSTRSQRTNSYTPALTSAPESWYDAPQPRKTRPANRMLKTKSSCYVAPQPPKTRQIQFNAGAHIETVPKHSKEIDLAVGKPIDGANGCRQEVHPGVVEPSGGPPTLAKPSAMETTATTVMMEPRTRDDHMKLAVKFAADSVDNCRNIDCVYEDERTGGKIYVGNLFVAMDIVEIDRRWITHLVDAREDGAQNYVEDYTEIEYMHFPIASWKLQPLMDTPAGVIRYFKPLFDYVARATASGGHVLIYCKTGAHRASAATIASIMELTGRGMKDVIVDVQKRRPSIDIDGSLKVVMDRLDAALGHNPLQTPTPTRVAMQFGGLR